MWLFSNQGYFNYKGSATTWLGFYFCLFKWDGIKLSPSSPS